MAEFSKLRLVCCPKCENLLPELPDISLYQCGGCGAVLKAKKKGISGDGLTNISDDVKYTRKIGERNLLKASEVQMEGDEGIGKDRMERTHKERGASGSNSKSQAQSGELLADSYVDRRGKERIQRRFNDEYMSYSRGLLHKSYQGNNHDLNMDWPEYINSQSEHAKEIRHPVESLRSRPVMDQWGVKSNGSEFSRRPAEPARDITSRGMYDNFLYHHEGPSTYNMNSYYEHCERKRYPSRNLDGVATIENLENSRAELLQKLDELKDQLSRSCELEDKPKRRVHTHRSMVLPSAPDSYGGNHNVYAQELLNSKGGGNNNQFSPNDFEARYTRKNPRFIPYMNRYGMSIPDSYSPRQYSNELIGYDDPYQPELLYRPPHPTHSHYMHQHYHGKFSGYNGDVNHNAFMLQRHEDLFNQHACSCVHCCNKTWHVPPKVDPLGSHNLRSRNKQSNPNLYHDQNPMMHRPQSYSSRASSFGLLHSQDPTPLNSSELVRKNDGSNNHSPRKVVAAHTNVQMSRPIAGGAPLVTCVNCFELLKLPKKCIASTKKGQKLKCGACSSIILFELSNKGFIASVSARVEEVPTEIDDVLSGAGDENVRYWHGGSNCADMNTCPNNDNYSEIKVSSLEKEPTSGKFEKHLDPLSPTSSLSEDEESPENLPSGKHDPPPATLPLKQVESFSQSDLSSRESHDHCSDTIEVNQFEKGDKIKKSDHESVLIDRTTSRQNSLKDEAVATELDMPLNEFSNGCVSQDSVEISKEDHPSFSGRVDSSFAGFKDKSLREFTESNQSVEVAESQVYVNGHLIPDSGVKKAERLAGPIQPGEYWYDIQAGFWGVMGHPCLGIIMPNIEEFDYPMLESCAAGNTGVFVNGRELHQKDLDLLSSRGLPTTRHRSYIVEISGKVVDDHTGEELDGLGKLAPTVEKANQGFGMKVPRFIAQLQS